jgi:hypothetical protein
MHGIVSLLDSKHNQFIEELWAELKQEFSVDGVYITPYPHFSYHVAQDYDVDKIERDFNWEIIVNNISFFYNTGTEQEMKSRFDITDEPVHEESSMERLHRRPLSSELLEQVYRVHEEIMQGTQGRLFEDSTEIIRQQREERTQHLMGEDEE